MFYWSNVFEIAKICNMTAQAVITHFKVEFIRHGIPDATNGKLRQSQDINCSRYPQFNRKVKALIKLAKTAVKAGEDREGPQLESLVWHNTPSEGTSPT